MYMFLEYSTPMKTQCIVASQEAVCQRGEEEEVTCFLWEDKRMRWRFPGNEWRGWCHTWMLFWMGAKGGDQGFAAWKFFDVLDQRLRGLKEKLLTVVLAWFTLASAPVTVNPCAEIRNLLILHLILLPCLWYVVGIMWSHCCVTAFYYFIQPPTLTARLHPAPLYFISTLMDP